MRSRGGLMRVCAAVLSIGCASTAFAGSGDWQQTVFIYGMGAAIDGDAQIGDIKIPVDVSISELFDHLDFGAMGAYRAENGTWSYTIDATYMSLGGSFKTEGGRLKGDLSTKQTTLMGTVGRRWTDNLEFLFSLAYFDLSNDLKLKLTLPVSGDVVTRKASDSVSWIDPLVGLQYNVPFAGNWRFNLRGDIGGFGIGSDLSYQALANFRWQANDTVGLIFGYRLIAFDYEDGKKGSAKYQRYDLTEQGPVIAVSLSF